MHNRLLILTLGLAIACGGGGKTASKSSHPTLATAASLNIGSPATGTAGCSGQDSEMYVRSDLPKETRAWLEFAVEPADACVVIVSQDAEGKNVKVIGKHWCGRPNNNGKLRTTLEEIEGDGGRTYFLVSTTDCSKLATVTLGYAAATP